MSAATSTDRRELAFRHNDGIVVTLFWSKTTNQVTLEVIDSRSNDTLTLEVDGSVALDAFHHPYAYAARRVTAPPVTCS